MYYGYVKGNWNIRDYHRVRLQEYMDLWRMTGNKRYLFVAAVLVGAYAR